MPAVVPFVRHPRFVFPTHGAVSLLLRQWFALQLPSAPRRMLGTASRTRGNPSALGGERLLAVAFDHDALGAPDVNRTRLYLLHLVVRFDMLDNLRHHRSRSPSPPTPFAPDMRGTLTRNGF